MNAQRTELIRLFNIMLTKQSIDNDEYLQANISASNTISLDAIMMVSNPEEVLNLKLKILQATQVRAITNDVTFVTDVLRDLSNVSISFDFKFPWMKIT